MSRAVQDKNWNWVWFDDKKDGYYFNFSFNDEDEDGDDELCGCSGCSPDLNDKLNIKISMKNKHCVDCTCYKCSCELRRIENRPYELIVPWWDNYCMGRCEVCKIYAKIY